MLFYQAVQDLHSPPLLVDIILSGYHIGDYRK